MPGASWVLLDSAGAATCSAASLFITVDESRQIRKTQSPDSAYHDTIYAAYAAANVVQWILRRGQRHLSDMPRLSGKWFSVSLGR
jgi:hypothetical protein